MKQLLPSRWQHSNRQRSSLVKGAEWFPFFIDLGWRSRTLLEESPGVSVERFVLRVTDAEDLMLVRQISTYYLPDISALTIQTVHRLTGLRELGEEFLDTRGGEIGLRGLSFQE